MKKIGVWTLENLAHVMCLLHIVLVLQSTGRLVCKR